MQPSQDPAGARPPVEVGVVVAGPMASETREVVRRALQGIRDTLSARLPELEWYTAMVYRREATTGTPADPVRLVDLGVLERDAAHWDFAFVVTELPLLSDEKPFMRGAPAQALDVAVLSTTGLAPPGDESEEARSQLLCTRLQALMMHLFGHLNDLTHADDPSDVMFDVRHTSDLDAMRELSPDDLEQLRRRLHEVADPRLEERAEHRGRFMFYLRAAWTNRHEIVSGVLRMQPWRFPLMYSRLSTAAVSALLLLLLTAEAWELGMSQPPARVAGLSAAALVGTSYYVVRRQNLLSRLGHRLSEQLVVGSVSVSLAVLLGMLTAYTLLYATTWTVGKLFFDAELVRGWAASLPTVGQAQYQSLAGFTASTGIVMGALGASFEESNYFRRAALLDEET